MKALVGLLCSLVLLGCGAASLEPPGSDVCYVETRGPERHVNCTEPTPDVRAAECSEVGSDALEPCARVLAGADCTPVDVDSWHCVRASGQSDSPARPAKP